MNVQINLDAHHSCQLPRVPHTRLTPQNHSKPTAHVFKYHVTGTGTDTTSLSMLTATTTCSSCCHHGQARMHPPLAGQRCAHGCCDRTVCKSGCRTPGMHIHHGAGGACLSSRWWCSRQPASAHPMMSTRSFGHYGFWTVDGRAAAPLTPLGHLQAPTRLQLPGLGQVEPRGSSRACGLQKPTACTRSTRAETYCEHAGTWGTWDHTVRGVCFGG